MYEIYAELFVFSFSKRDMEDVNNLWREDIKRTSRFKYLVSAIEDSADTDEIINSTYPEG